MKTSTKFSIAAAIALLAVVGILMKGYTHGALSYTEVFLTCMSAAMIMLLQGCSSLMQVRETLIDGAHKEISLMDAAKGYDVQVVYSDILPRIPWLLGGSLYRDGNVVAILTCLWHDVENKTIHTLRVIRTHDDRLPVKNGPGDKAWIQVPQVI